MTTKKAIIEKLNTKTTNKTKQDTRTMIRDAVNAEYHCARTTKAFKSKWKAMMAQVKSQKDHTRGTGGGPMMRESPFTAAVLLILDEESQ